MSFKQKISYFLQQTQLFAFSLYFVLFSWQQWWSGVAPRLIRGSEERVAIHHQHLVLGATLFVILVLFLLIWLLKPGQSPVEKLKSAFKDASSTAVSLFMLMSLFLMLFGLSQAWSKDEEAAVLGVFNLPHFLNFSWQTSGYMHAALSSITVFLFSGIVFVFLYRKLREYMEAGYAVALLMLIHLLVVLPQPPSLHPIAAFGSYVLKPFIYLCALAIYAWANNRKLVYWPIYTLFFVFFLYLPYFAFKVLPPWHQPTAKETVIVAPVAELVPIRSAAEIFPDDASFQSAQETTAWCRQCHTVDKGAEHLLGPNLAGVFNQQAGTADGYGRYSPAVQKKGEEGIFWTRENLAEFLTDGPNFIPGNLMNQQTDLSDPEKLQQVLDYLEYISSE